MISKTALASHVLARSGLGNLIRRTGRNHSFVVLNYHRVGEVADAQCDRGVISATPEQFARELALLKYECDVILPQDIADLPRRGRGNYAMITFDDGYRDNYQLAFPALKAAGVPAVFFVATGYLDRPRLAWWDEIAWMVRSSKRAQIGPGSTLPTCMELGPDREGVIGSLLGMYKKLPPEAAELFLQELGELTGAGRCPAQIASDLWMTWSMLREMRDAGMVIGGHTVNHPILANLPRPQQASEIAGCAEAIRQNLGEEMRYFSYPRGKPDSFNEDTRTLLRQNQVQYAFSYYGGVNRLEALDPLDVRRVAVENDTLIEHFEAMITLPSVFA